MDNYLQHYGIEGQKWGVRRYQNPDGTYTAAGKQRYFGSKNKKTPEEKQADAAKTIVKDTVDMANQYVKINDKAKEKEQKRETKKEAQEMTDKELQEYINRQNLENNYVRLKLENDNTIREGESWLKENWPEVSSMAMDAVEVAAMIALFIKLTKK